MAVYMLLYLQRKLSKWYNITITTCLVVTLTSLSTYIYTAMLIHCYLKSPTFHSTSTVARVLGSGLREPGFESCAVR